jgi:hypothetical protein
MATASVNITPSGEQSKLAGAKFKFSVEVGGQDQTNNATWSVEGNTSTDTTISKGVLIIGATEKGPLKVCATYNETKSTSVTVKIVAASKATSELASSFLGEWIAEYLRSNPANTPMGALAEMVAVGQEENYNFGKTRRWPKITDMVDAKWSLVCFNNNINVESTAINGLVINISGIGPFSAFLTSGAAGAHQFKTRVGFNGNDAAKTKVAAMVTSTAGMRAHTI